eukprot:TRINITY_DN1516_c0_g1_i1.p4 TRINITY_DN1516_c0_g1~~TRINITY_DN1516_c0_g1_i1.p4  ORF type:complete len:50 (-),score=8.75 TRINITY_DN1516_c0_g1_i1:45-194(-)
MGENPNDKELSRYIPFLRDLSSVSDVRPFLADAIWSKALMMPTPGASKM